LRVACGPPAARQRRHQAQAAVQQGGGGAPAQRGLHTGKVASAQVAAQQVQRGLGQQRAQGDACHAARQPQQARFEQHQRQPLPWRGTQHRQQRKLWRALCHAQRQHRKHQKRPCEQGHQRQHREVDAVRARQQADALGGVARLHRHGVGGPPGLAAQRLREGAAVGAGLQAQVDAAERAAAPEQVLRGAQIHHGQGAAAGCHAASHAHHMALAACLQHQCGGGLCRLRGQAQRLECRRVEEHGGRLEQRKPLAAIPGPGHEGGGHAGQHQGVGTQHAQRDREATAGAARHRGELQHRAGLAHLGVRGQGGVQGLIQRALHGAHLQVGLAVDTAHRLGKFIER
jgi:hypothetical protein